MNRSFLQGLTVTSICLLATGCAWLRSGDPPAKATASSVGEDAVAGTTLADKRLAEIQAEQQALAEAYARDANQFDATEWQRRLRQLADRYDAYLAENPEDTTALILYGKFLRSVDATEQAVEVFLRVDQIDPDIAVVKQQIGNYLAENGRYMAALTYFLRALELDPEVARYHFQVGELLFRYREEFLLDGLYSRSDLDAAMLDAFRQAYQFEPDNTGFALRLGEAFYDIRDPDWAAARTHWETVLAQVDEPLTRDACRLHLARVLGKLGQLDKARELAETVTAPALQHSRNALLTELDGGSASADG
ncbi:MAG: tetratricopeptide repeat protein [Opitutales bacterium]